MNRRSFFKIVTGFVAGVYVACVPGKKSKADVDKIISETLSNDPNWKSTKILEKPWHHSHFKDRHFIAHEKRIRWSVVGEFSKWSQPDYVDLPSFDACEGLINSEGKLYWLGFSELWEICYTGEHQQPFVFEYKGEIERFNKRFGCRAVILNDDFTYKLKVNNKKA
ncbi:hypothetical protein LCGC14_1397400 [marine sediment metagenome]|uniref:Uncharacterized protein n=1 Tax=marine sediment metagenome TaxID=412755 RepID=A0A0F9KJ21_9ZZZZ